MASAKTDDDDYEKFSNSDAKEIYSHNTGQFITETETFYNVIKI